MGSHTTCVAYLCFSSVLLGRWVCLFCLEANSTCKTPRRTAPINSRLNMVMQSPTPFGLGQNGCWPSRGFQVPGHSPSFFRYAAPWTTAEGQHTASSKSVACFLFFFSPALLRLLIILLLLMSSNVHPNPGPMFPCSVCAGNVIWRGKPVQCCTCYKSVHLRCSKLSLSKFRALGSSHSWSCPPAVTLWLPPRTPLTCIPPLCNLAPFCYCSTLAPPSYPNLLSPSAHFISSSPAPSPPSLAPGCPSASPASSPPLTLSGFFNGMLEVFEPGALNYFTFSQPTLSTLSVSRNPILTHLPLSGFLDSLLCALIAPTPGLAFSLLMPHMLVAVLSFSWGRAYLFLNFLPPLFLCLIPTLIM